MASASRSRVAFIVGLAFAAMAMFAGHPSGRAALAGTSSNPAAIATAGVADPAVVPGKVGNPVERIEADASSKHGVPLFLAVLIAVIGLWVLRRCRKAIASGEPP